MVKFLLYDCHLVQIILSLSFLFFTLILSFYFTKKMPSFNKERARLQRVGMSSKANKTLLHFKNKQEFEGSV